MHLKPIPANRLVTRRIPTDATRPELSQVASTIAAWASKPSSKVGQGHANFGSSSLRLPSFETIYRLDECADPITRAKPFVFRRSDMTEPHVQEILARAKREGLRVTCGCGNGAGLDLLIVGGSPRLHLSRRAQDSSGHRPDCAHGKQPPEESRRRGYKDGVMHKTDCGEWDVDIGDLLFSGVANEEPLPPEPGEGSGRGTPETRLRSTSSAMGLLCLLLEQSMLHKVDWRPLSDPWSLLDKAARNIKPRGYVSTWGLSDYLMLEGNRGNFHRLEAARKTRGILFTCVLPPHSVLDEKGQIHLRDKLRVDVRVGQQTLNRAFRRHSFAAKQYKAGCAVLVLGRAHITEEIEADGETSISRCMAIADRVVLMAVDEPRLTPLPAARDLKRFEKASQVKGKFEARLPYDRR